MSTPIFKRVIEGANSGRRYPVMDLVRQDPGLAATISKLVPAIEPPQFGVDGNRTPNTPNMAEFKTLSDRTAQSINDAQTVMQVLPEMELAAQILISSILAPKDMMTTELTYSVPEGLMAPDVASAMIARVKQHFEQVYKIKTKLQRFLRDILFETGSVPLAVIPENSIDEAINGPSKISLEQLSESFTATGEAKAVGLLGPVVRRTPSQERASARLTLESYDTPVPSPQDCRVTFETSFQRPADDTFVTVTDNFNVLKIPRINQKVREERILNTIKSPAMEAFGGRLNDRDLSSLMYKERNFKYRPIATLKTQEELARHTVGNPLILHLPSEAVIPVYVPGNVEQQIGFFVMLDMDGNPVTKTDNKDHYTELSNRLNGNGSFPSAMLSKVRAQMNGFDMTNRHHLDYSARVYGNMVEQDLLSRLRNGVYGNGVALAKREEIYRIMLSRALAKQHTQLLFVPIELMTYMALRFDERGVGKSLLEDMKIINSLRSMLVFGNVMASLKNSIGRTEVKIKLDEADPNPQKTIELAMHEIIRSRQQYFPLGMNSPTDLVDWLQRSGFEFTHEGHPGLPDVAIDFGEKSSNYPKPDTELEELLRKRSLMAMGLNPETVDAGFTADFATTVVANNLLLAKRVSQIQEQFEPLLGDHLHKCAMNSQELMDDLKGILEENFDKLKLEKGLGDAHKRIASDPAAKALLVGQFLREFVMSFEVSLPRPNTVTLENQLDALKKYMEALDVAINSYISSTFYTSEMNGTTAGYVDTVKEMLKAYFVRQWMAENGMLSELSKITTTDEEGRPMLDFFDIQKGHMKGLTDSVGGLIKTLSKLKDKSDKKLEKAGVDAGSGSSYSGASDYDSSGGSDDGGFDTGGSDPFAGLDEAGGAEQPAEGEQAASATDEPATTDEPAADETAAGADEAAGGAPAEGGAEDEAKA